MAALRRVELLVHCARKPRAGNHAFVQFLTPLDCQAALNKVLTNGAMGNHVVEAEQVPMTDRLTGGGARAGQRGEPEGWDVAGIPYRR